MANTQELITEFLKDCQERGISQHTIYSYHGYLRHFALAFPEGVPWDWPSIEWYLTKKVRKKSAIPTHKKRLQALYSFLERKEYGKSPIPQG